MPTKLLQADGEAVSILTMIYNKICKTGVRTTHSVAEKYLQHL